jgi:hypothetical protein
MGKNYGEDTKLIYDLADQGGEDVPSVRLLTYNDVNQGPGVKLLLHYYASRALSAA